ncbi:MULTISPECIES: type II toxin-antitoxin system HicA family toxin [Raineya]|jgi:predicted RNA binding protein YcfA (HicA-like mRNA interferase family)|uniref:YcfA-like protein n=1 Tax=Raineya orbicola TaxID=2016530 RepID=A0A2N3IKQ5_9BACT|nr:type II toxin-antitoxin system HicA family toxin [Raineya orbicola]PKQ70919.1 YcfA-like protein [Raineya orbicola]
MKLPRDLSGLELAQKLKKFGYEITRQTGSHIRLTTQEKGEHHITIPAHNPLKVGTLSAILLEVAQHFNISKNEVIEEIS